ncbi:Phosphorylated carbohydrates phosphatase [subsurface metagenome]
MAGIGAFIFDLDGVMVDTEPISHQAWHIILKDFDLDLDEETYHGIIGRRSDESAQIIKSSLGLSLDASELVRRKKKALKRLLSRDIAVMPGLGKLVERLSDAGIAWAVATSSPRRYARDILTRIGLLEKCAVLAGGDEVLRGKPEPDIYLLAAERLGVLPQGCLALEDSLPGCQAAIAAGMVTLAVTNGQTKRSEFGFVDHVYTTLSEVADNLESLIR